LAKASSVSEDVVLLEVYGAVLGKVAVGAIVLDLER